MIEAVYDDGLSVVVDKTNKPDLDLDLGEDVGCVVYPDWHGSSKVRVEVNCNKPTFKVVYEELAARQALIDEANALVAERRADMLPPEPEE